MSEMIDVVFDGFPSPDGAKFIEVETDGKSVLFGEWRDLREGYKALSFPNPRAAMESALAKLDEFYVPEDDGMYRVMQEIGAMINEFPKQN